MHTLNGTNSTVLVCKIKRRVGKKWWLNRAWGPLFYRESRFYSKDSTKVRILILFNFLSPFRLCILPSQSANPVLKDTVRDFGTASSFHSSQLFHLMKNKRNVVYLLLKENLAVLASLEDLGLFPVNKATDIGLSGWIRYMSDFKNLFLLCVIFFLTFWLRT